MTLIAALQGSDGLVIAADSRGTIGDPRGLTAINDMQNKIHGLTQFTGIAISGSSELANQLILEIRQQLASQNIEFIENVLNLSRGIMRTRYNEWFSTVPAQQRPVVNFIIAGFCENKTDSRIYILSSPLDFAPQLASGTMLAGVPQYATYLIHRLYQPGMAIRQLVPLAAYVISETATQDPKVGGPIRIAQIEPEGGYEEISQREIQSIIAQNNEQNQRLRDFFFKGGEERNEKAVS